MDGTRILLLAAAAVPEGRVFGLDQQTLISIAIQLFNACVLAAALSFILYKPVRKFLNERAERINAQLQNAEERMANADKTKTRYEWELEKIEREKVEILESVQKQAEEKCKQMLESAQKEAATLLERAAQEIEGERERVNEEIRRHIIEVAAVLAERFVTQSIDAETMDRLFDETMAELEGAVWQA